MLHKNVAAGIFASAIVFASLEHHLAVADGKPGVKDKRARGFVADVGEYQLQGGRVRVKVSEKKAGRLEYGLTFADGTGQQRHTISDSLTKAGQDWFIYPSSPEVVWVFNGEKGLAVHTVTFTGENKADGQTEPPRSLPGGWSELLKRYPPPPKELVERLPAELRPQKH